MSEHNLNISVVVPVWNVEPYLRRCLDSILNQTMCNIEIICVNDCSTDASLELLREYETKDTRVKVINFTENKGVSAARNAGIDAAIGEYVGFVDSDDYISTDFYEKLYFRAKETNAEIVKTELFRVGSKGTVTKSLFNERIRKNKINFYCEFYSAIYKTSFLNENMLRFPENVLTFEDPVFSLKTILANKTLELVSGSYYYHIARENSKVTNFNKNAICSFLNGVKEILNILNNSDISQEDYLFVCNEVLVRSLWARCSMANTNKVDRTYAINGFSKIMNENLEYKIELFEGDNLTKHFMELSNMQRERFLSKLRENVKESQYA